MANSIKFKVIFVKNKKKDGTPFTKMMTILKDGSKDCWCEIKFGESVNTKLFKGENQIVTAKIDDIRFPLSLSSYVDKKSGKTKYPYVWCEKIESFEKMVGTNFVKKEFTFAMDEPDTSSVSTNPDELPFK